MELKGVGKTYILPSGERLELLADLDLTIAPGEVMAIVGRSGSGKSTLLNILGLLDKPTSGTVLCDGADTATLSDAQVAALRGAFVGFIFQQFHLFDRRTALENVAEPLLYAKAGDIATRKARASELLAQVGLTERAHAMPHQLSGGEQQRVAIARALVRRPRLVLADEPTGALDAVTGELVLSMLLDLVHAEGVALILVSHDRAVARRASHIFSLIEGKLHEQRS